MKLPSIKRGTVGFISTCTFESFMREEAVFQAKINSKLKLRFRMHLFFIHTSIHVLFIPYFRFWYFGHFSCVFFFLVFSCLAHLPLQNGNKDYVIFSYFHNFITKSDQKPKTKNGMNKKINTILVHLLQ